VVEVLNLLLNIIGLALSILSVKLTSCMMWDVVHSRKGRTVGRFL